MVIDYHAISWIESRCNQYAERHVGSDNSWGEFQITRVVLEEYNNHHHTGYTTQDLLDLAINENIAHWYMEVRIPQLLRHFGLPVTVDNCIICWNGGIRAAIHHHLSRITKRYIKEYHKLEA